MIVDRTRVVARLLVESRRALAVLFAWDILVVAGFMLFHRRWMDQPTLPVSLVGSALALFIGIRNNSSYARWWEARTLWGAVVNNTRSLARQAGTLMAGRPDLARASGAYAHALRAALARMPVDGDHSAALLGEAFDARVRGVRNRPNAILSLIGTEVARTVAEQRIDGAVHGQIDRILSDLANAQGGLERIRNTPLVVQFSVLPRLLMRVFCVILPLSMVQDLGWITPFGSALVSFLFLALDEIGAEIEDPFADSVHALPMRAMATTIEIDVLQGIGEQAPAPIEPIRGVLS